MRTRTLIGWIWLLGFPATVAANTWVEQGDAPPLPPGQQTQGVGSLTQIVGTLPGATDVDLFAINIDNPAGFSASTVGGAAFNTQLFLFNSTGLGVTHHDNVSAQNQQSQITGQFVPGPGVYFLGISGFNRDPFSPANQPLWNDQPFTVERPADGPGAANPVANWGGMGPGGPYTIDLTGARFVNQPPPPQITQHPVWQPVPLGGDATFGVSATGAPPLTYQWFHAGQIISGATGPTVTVLDVDEPDYGPYYVRVSDTFGQTVRSHSADLTVHVECVPPIANPGSCYIPEVWRIDPVPWNRDTAPQNKIDDLIDADPGVRHDIIVDFRSCVTLDHLDFLEGISVESSVSDVFHVITCVGMTNVSVTEIATIAGLNEVALIETNSAVGTELDVSLETMRVSGPTYSPETVDDAFGFTGAGFNIAIVDTGVDDSVHDTFTSDPSIFVAGYNTFTDLEGNPDDDHFHGTHVASIALGRGGALVPRGVAPGAGLIDVKALDADGSGTVLGIMRALQCLLDRQRDWNVHIVNMSIGAHDASNGVESFSQLSDRLVEQGIIVIAAAGNSGESGTPVIFPPARAARAITVAASDDLDTPTRADDVIATFSQWGPAIDNGNTDDYDELKPEVTAPGVYIVGAGNDSAMGPRELSGTSMAAPHVAGLAALCLQGQPSMNPESFRALLINTSERRGSPSSAGIGLSPAGWNLRFGWGLVDAYAAIAQQVAGPTDVTFGTNPVFSEWDNRNIGPVDFPANCGTPNEFFAVVMNTGANRADNIRVVFGVHNFSASAPPFIHVGTTVIGSLLPGATATVTLPWIPNCETLSAHQCLKVEIGCDNDENPLNNKAQRNLDVTSSPAYFQAANYVRNEPVTITFEAEWENPGNGWTVVITPPSVILAPEDLPRTIEVLPIPPPGTADGTQELLQITSRAADGTCLGGVAIIARMRDCNANGIDDWFDIRDGTSQDLDGSGIPDECELQCPGDLNGDRQVDLADLTTLLAHFGIQSGATLADGDVTGDGAVDLADLTSLLSEFGTFCP